MFVKIRSFFYNLMINIVVKKALLPTLAKQDSGICVVFKVIFVFVFMVFKLEVQTSLIPNLV